MQVFEFEKIIKTEKDARLYLLRCCEEVSGTRCLSCDSDKAYVIEGGDRRRCARCGHSFHPFQGRWMYRVKISAQKWLWIVKLFELDNPSSTIGQETGVSYPTVLKAVEAIRLAIIGGSMSRCDIELECDLDEGKPVLGALSGEQKSVQILEAVPKERIKCIATLAGDRVICTDRKLTYDSLLFGDQKLEIIDHGEHFPHFRVYSSGKRGFWQYAEERLVKHHGISPDKLMLYIKEQEFRYLNRDEQLFDILVEKLCHYAPV